MNRLRPWQQEKHYIQSLMLAILSDFPLVFKGGTYLWFFHGLRRFSEDLDFTSSGKIMDDLPSMVSRNLTLFGVENELKIIEGNGSGASFRIMANGPLNTGPKDRCVVYVEISSREDVLRRRIALRIDHPEYLIPVKMIEGMSLDEVSAEKVRAILTRNKSRDIYDLHFLITAKGVKFDEQMVNEKLKYYDIKFSKNSFMREITSRERNFHRELRGMILDSLPEYSNVLEKIKEWLG